MIKILRFILILNIALGVFSTRSYAINTITVYVYNNEFSINPPGQPIQPAVIVQGDYIKWVWVQGTHTTTSVNGSSETWDAAITMSDMEYTRQFNNVGVFWYYCIPHGVDNDDGTASGMASTITVLPAGQGACCLPDGSCITSNEGECIAQEGIFSGEGILCSTTSCDVRLKLNASKDNILYQSATGTLSNALGNHVYAGNNANGIRRGLISFDLSSIPTNAQVTQVELQLYCNSSSGASYPITLYKLLKNWGEGTSDDPTSTESNGTTATTGDATWLHTFYNTVFWTNPGGDFTNTPSATTNVNAASTFFSWTSEQLMEDVQEWVEMPDMNFGWVIRGDESSSSNSKRFSSRSFPTVAQRPVLKISYIIPPTGACCYSDGTCSETTQMACSMAGGTYKGDGSTCATTVCSLPLTPYLDALPLPGVATPLTGTSGGEAHYKIFMTEQFQKLHSDLPPTRVWGYNGSYPGPTIEAHRDKQVTVEWVNDLRVFETGELRTEHVLTVDECLHGPDHTGKVPVAIVHLHGGKVGPESDGHPDDAFPPGQSSPIYTYPNSQPAGTLWYHDHALGITRLNVMMGMAGLYLLRDDQEKALNIPKGEFEIPLVVQDRSFNADGSINYPNTWDQHFFGNVILVNGKVWPYLNVKKGKYRFRLVNGSNSRSYTFALSNHEHFYQIGTELGLMEAPLMLDKLTLTPGERAEIVIDFADYAAGTEIILTNSAPAPFPGFPGVGVIPNVMKFIVLDGAGHTDPLPASLVSIEKLKEEDALQERIFELKQIAGEDCGGHMHLKWTINGMMWDDITEYPALGTTEIWTWHNQSGVSHPMHMHLVSFQILDRQALDANGQPTGPKILPSPGELGWKDTADSPPGYRTRVIARFEGFKGVFPYHCHILEHEDHEMMRQFKVVDVGECDDKSTTISACDSYTWNDVVYTTSGTYLKQVTTPAGCVITETLILTINQSSESTITETACGNYTLEGVSYTVSGQYTQVIKNEAGCDHTVTLNLTIINMNKSVTTVANVLTATETGATYQWINCNNNVPIAGETNRSFTVTESGSYAVQITKNNCTEVSECTDVTIVGLQDEFQEGVLFPNPTSGRIIISHRQKQIQPSVRVMNVSGQQIAAEVSHTSEAIEIDITPASKGWYIIEVVVKDSLKRYRVIKY